jgi:hypothetical protein
MKSLTIACLISLAVFSFTDTHADTWLDPSFREMIETCDVIGVFRVVEGGTFKAKLVPVSIYKGKVKGEIWLGGFSNRYGPIDTLSVGEVYVLFVTRAKDRKSRYVSSSNKSVMPEAYEAALYVMHQKNGYFVPTPTSGEYKVINDKVFLPLADLPDRVTGLSLEDLKRAVQANRQ